ncbi:MAG: CPBP family intramembrane metalloprotease, partial [Erysipelotrichaceae bacterium]|nr:CPBP family intramembrane metalloprotease [Erysipelotrichaceae bacterium]
MKKADKGNILTIIGIVAMTLLVLMRLLLTHQLTEYSLVVGIALFFIVEWVSKTPEEESGLRFKTFFADLKKCGPLLWLILLAISIGDIVLGTALFGRQYVDHILGRTDAILNFENILVLTVQFIIGALGEEIAFRGFFTGKGMILFGFWPVALVSSAVFALAHLASGNTAVVIFDLAGIFIDAILYSLIMRKTNNCLVSAVAHFLMNMIGMIEVYA